MVIYQPHKQIKTLSKGIFIRYDIEWYNIVEINGYSGLLTDL